MKKNLHPPDSRESPHANIFAAPEKNRVAEPLLDNQQQNVLPVQTPPKAFAPEDASAEMAGKAFILDQTVELNKVNSQYNYLDETLLGKKIIIPAGQKVNSRITLKVMKKGHFVLLLIICFSCSEPAKSEKKTLENPPYIEYVDYEMSKRDTSVLRSQEDLIILHFKTNLPLKTPIIVTRRTLHETVKKQGPMDVQRIDTIVLTSNTFIVPYSPFYVSGQLLLEVGKEKTYNASYFIDYKRKPSGPIHLKVPVYPLEINITQE